MRSEKEKIGRRPQVGAVAPYLARTVSCSQQVLKENDLTSIEIWMRKEVLRRNGGSGSLISTTDENLPACGFRSAKEFKMGKVEVTLCRHDGK